MFKLILLTALSLSLIDIAKFSPNGSKLVRTGLDSKSFELVAEIRDLQSGTYIVMEERYSVQQSRGLVSERVHYNNENEVHTSNWRRSWFKSTRVFLADTREDISVVRNEDTDTCELFERNAIMKALRLDFIDFNMGQHEYIFGTARLLHYFSRIFPDLMADISGARYMVKNVPSARYTKRFKAPSGDQVEVSVFYSERSLEAANRQHALPIQLRFEWPKLDVKPLVIEFSQLKFNQGDSLAEEPELGLKLDALVLEPVSGCSELVLASNGSRGHKYPWPEMDGSERRTDRFSFRANVRKIKLPVSRNNEDTFDVQVAYDIWLNKMRVDMRAPDKMALVSSTQIFDFALDKMTHILARPKPGKYDFVNELIEAHQRDSRLSPRANLAAAASGPMSGQELGEQLVAARGFRCSNAQLGSASSAPVTFTLDSLLLGSSQNFVYMGLARVRGVKARLFEAVDTQLPFWLDPQLDPRVQNPSSKRASMHKLVTLVYFSVPSSEMESRLLLIEIYELDHDRKSILGKREISVYDFAWNLQAIQARPLVGSLSSADEALSLFSLVNYCSEWIPNSAEQLDSESHANFELLLKSANPLPSSAHLWLRQNVPEVRMALLNTLQLDMHLILGLIYDLETRFIELPATDIIRGGTQENELSTANQQQQQHLTLAASFKVGRLPNTLTKMLYLGQGGKGKARNFWFLQANSLQDCFMIAGHLKFETEFAYDPKSSSCYIVAEPQQSKNGKRDGTGHFMIDPSADWNVFKTLKMRDYHKITHEWWASEPMRYDFQKRGLRLDIPSFKDSIKLNIDRLKLNQHTPRLLDGNSQAATSSMSASIFLGLGLVEQAGLTRVGRLEPLRESSQTDTNLNHTEERLTLGQCQALCQSDFACRSYSHCINGLKMECILSQVDLSSTKLIFKLDSMLKYKTPANTTAPGDSRFKLQVDDGKTITLVRNRHCTIYNKQHLNYYTKQTKDLISGSNFASLRPASSAEDCASVCFKMMLNSLRDHHETLSSSLNELEQDMLGSKEEDEAQTLGLLNKVKQMNAAVKTNGCFRFYFIETLNLNSISKEARAKLESLVEEDEATKATETNGPGSDSDQKQQAAGYCAMLTRNQSLETQVERQVLVADSYSFKVDQLYEESYGLQLRGSSLSTEEQKALDEVKLYTSVAPDVHSIELVKGLLKRGDNLQLLVATDREQCASYCFTQSVGLWPWCRSFDFVLQQTNKNRTRTRCILNTLSKSQAIEMGRQDLVDSSHAFQANEERWHYELKEGLLSAEQIEWEAETLPALARDHTNDTTNYFSKGNLARCIWFGLALGLFLGILLSELRQTPRKRNSLSSTIEFGMS